MNDTKSLQRVRRLIRVVRRMLSWVKSLAENKLFLVGSIVLACFVLLAIAPGLFAPYGYLETDAINRFQPPTFKHLLGTDRFGRDVLSRLIYGTRTSLRVSFISVTFALFSGGTLGLIAGFYGNIIDQVLSRLMDVLFGLPMMLLAIILAAILGSGETNAIIAIAVVFSPIFFRVTRGSTIQEKEKDYVSAANACGASNFRIMFSGISRNVVAPVVVQGAVQFSFAIITEAALGYLGLGVQPPTPSWGSTLSAGKDLLQLAPWISMFAGVFIMLAILSSNMMSDGLRDILDPKMRQA